MSKFVAVEINGEITVHAPPDGPGCYDTLCGLDADDPDLGHNGKVHVPLGAKINCVQCKAVWSAAKQLRASDFDTSLSGTYD